MKISTVNPWIEILTHQTFTDLSRLSVILAWINECKSQWMGNAFHIVNSKDWFIGLGWTRSPGLEGNLGSWHRYRNSISVVARQVDLYQLLVFNKASARVGGPWLPLSVPSWRPPALPAKGGPTLAPHLKAAAIHTEPAWQLSLKPSWLLNGRSHHAKVIGNGLSTSRQGYCYDPCFSVVNRLSSNNF